ncbi:UDP-glucose dehydrogenase family protein [Streptomyces cellostaticus]|uniref:UDP-glucose dehydrogenase family protein n=1 Tax=Streptomyces cellostaticus TaxID=67285 RepID=UPI000834AB28|nr:UDP-glucose/GDP-mannose dehydrogenase family protein [Streptomyces cellostaticus]GHI07616.1 UDP-glucose 6-dehydrogenase [Streptomyces cellostaticus]
MSADTPRPRISFIGTGYLGTTYAACFADLGYDVIGYDNDIAKAARLASGALPFHEPGLDTLLRRNIAAGRLSFTSDIDETARFADIHFICVGTPQRPDGLGADLGHVETAVTALARHLHRDALIVGKSTVPVGTAEHLERLAREHAPAGLAVDVSWSPEFLQEGRAVEDVLRPSRIVFGVRDESVLARLHAAHEGLYRLAEQEARELPLLVTDFATAELVKVAANSFLATKISFINAMAEVCGAAGGDITELAKALGHDPRIGPAFLRAGVGFGGGCLGKDIRAFQHRARELGADGAAQLLHEVDLINQRSRARTVELATAMLGGTPGDPRPDLSGRTVAVLGATFKPDSDDVRDSPALAVASALRTAGARVRVYDPMGTDNARRAEPLLDYAEDLEAAATGADLVCVLTEWAEFRDADPVVLGKVVSAPRVLDGRNCLDPAAWRQAGWTYRALGRGTGHRIRTGTVHAPAGEPRLESVHHEEMAHV